MTRNTILLGGGALLALAWLARRQAGAVGAALNPADPENLVYGGVNAVGDVLDNGQDDDSFSLGSWYYDLLHPEENNIEWWGKF